MSDESSTTASSGPERVSLFGGWVHVFYLYWLIHMAVLYFSGGNPMDAVAGIVLAFSMVGILLWVVVKALYQSPHWCVLSVTVRVALTLLFAALAFVLTAYSGSLAALLLILAMVWVWKKRPGPEYVASIRAAEAAVARGPYNDLTEQALHDMPALQYVRGVLDRPIST